MNSTGLKDNNLTSMQQRKTLIKISEIHRNRLSGNMRKQNRFEQSSKFLHSQQSQSIHEQQRFSRVLSQVKLLEDIEQAQPLIKTLKGQAKTLKVSRKRILKQSNSMEAYSNSILDFQRSRSCSRHGGTKEAGSMLESCASVGSFASQRSSSSNLPVKATKDAVDFKKLKRMLSFSSSKRSSNKL